MTNGPLPLLISLLISAALVALLEGRTSMTWRARWAARGIQGPLHARSWTAARILAPLAASAAAAYAYESVAAGVVAAAIIWLALVAACLDLASCKIPREACWTVLGIGTVAVIADWNAPRFASFLLAFAMTGLSLGLVALLTRGKLGSGDVRLMLAFTPFTAWAGYTTIFIAILAAAVIQVPLRALLRRHVTMTGPGFPFGPALGLGMLIAVLIAGTPGASEATWTGILTG